MNAFPCSRKAQIPRIIIYTSFRRNSIQYWGLSYQVRISPMIRENSLNSDAKCIKKNSHPPIVSSYIYEHNRLETKRLYIQHMQIRVLIDLGSGTLIFIKLRLKSVPVPYEKTDFLIPYSTYSKKKISSHSSVHVQYLKCWNLSYEVRISSMIWENSLNSDAKCFKKHSHPPIVGSYI